MDILAINISKFGDIFTNEWDIKFYVKPWETRAQSSATGGR